MNIFKKALILSLSLLLFHGFSAFLLSLFDNYIPKALNDAVAILIYTLVYASWAYYLISLFYLFITRNIPNVYIKIFIALLWMSVGYIMFRGGDIIDGHFISNFHWAFAFVFFLSALFLVGVDLLLKKRSQRKIKDE